MENKNRSDLERVITLLNHQNADVLQYISPEVELALRKRYKRIQREEWRMSLPWMLRVAISLVWWCCRMKKEPLQIRGSKYSRGTEGFLYEMALNTMSQASGVPLGQTEPYDRTAAIVKVMRESAQAIASYQRKLDGFSAPENHKAVAEDRNNWETVFIYLQKLMKGLPRDHKVYWKQ